MLLLHDEFKLTEKDIRLFFWSTIEIVIIIGFTNNVQCESGHY